MTRKLSAEELFFCLYFIPMLILKGFGCTDGPVYKGVILFSGLMILCKILSGRRSYSIPEYLLILVLLSISFLVWHQSGNIAVFMGSLMVLSMKNMNPKKVFRIGSVLWLFCFTAQFVMGITGITAPQFVIHNKFHFGYIIRWAFGFTHPNVLQISYVVLILYILYGFGNGISMKRLFHFLVIAAVGALYVFIYTLSITGMLSFVAMVLFILYFEGSRHAGRKRSIAENVILELIFPVCILFSILAPILLTGRSFELLNSIMTNRPSLTRFFFQNYPLTPFGQDFTDLPSVLTLDCSYANLLFYGGLVIFLLMCTGYLITIHQMLHESPSYENSAGLTILYTVVITAVSEPFAFNTSCKNVSLFLVGSCIYFLLERMASSQSKLSNFNYLHKAMPVNKNYHIFHVALSSAERMDKKPDEHPDKHLSVSSGTDFETDSSENVRRRLFIPGREMPSATAIILLVFLFIAGGLFGNSIYRNHVHLPEDIYALRSSCDTDYDSVNVYLTPEKAEQLRQSGDVWILNYTDASTPLLKFDGITIQAEYIRGQISSFLWMGLLFDLIAVPVCHCWNKYHKIKTD